MKKLGVFGSFLLIVGAVLILSSFSGMTGFAISNGVNGQVCSALGIALFVGGILIFTVNIFEERRRTGRNVAISGLEEITYDSVQANRKPPVDANHINLKQLEEYLAKDVVSAEDKEKIKNKYYPEIIEKINQGYFNYLKYRAGLAPESSRVELAKELRVSRGAERVLKILDSHYVTRTENIQELKKAVGEKPYIFNPIRHGEAVYVHFTSADSAERIKSEGLKKGDSLYFPNINAAEKYLDETSQKEVKADFRARASERAIIFQTPSIPKISRTTGTGKTMAEFNGTVAPKDCYRFEIRNVKK